ncbi:hypothetical protein BD779DRAFT_1784494 [Infundibulicybe gibba]|nr:hypothetical protein BD779DRAFT_1784494 [Infundibulicybe gibba]
MEVDTPTSKLDELTKQIQHLTDLYNSFATLRQIPQAMLKSPLSQTVPFAVHSLKSEFQHIRDLSDTIRSEPVQGALREAKDSLKRDRTELGSHSRRENRKRRRLPSPESPRPYIPHDRDTIKLFPSVDAPPLRSAELMTYITELNGAIGETSRLRIWRRTRSTAISEKPPILQFSIPNVLTAYIMLGYHPENSVIMTESLTIFGPLERKAPHLQSQYTVYRTLSQQLAKLLQTQPQVSLQSLVIFLKLYKGLFIEKCANCGRVLSSEGHVPPVARVWQGDGKSAEGTWQPRHIGCLQG